MNPASADMLQSGHVLRDIIDAVIIIDENGGIESCNPAATAAFGYSTQEMADLDIAAIIPGFSTAINSVLPVEVPGGMYVHSAHAMRQPDAARMVSVFRFKFP